MCLIGNMIQWSILKILKSDASFFCKLYSTTSYKSLEKCNIIQKQEALEKGEQQRLRSDCASEKGEQQRLRSDCADAQSDLSLLCSHDPCIYPEESTAQNVGST